MDQLFEKASRLKLRINYKGVCSIEDLWDVSLIELNKMFQGLTMQLKHTQGESLLEVVKTKANELIELKIEIVRHIVKIKLEEQKARMDRKKKAELKQRYLAIIATKQDEIEQGKSIKELTKLMEEL